jgi:hypothetical protein
MALITLGGNWWIGDVVELSGEHLAIVNMGSEDCPTYAIQILPDAGGCFVLYCSGLEHAHRCLAVAATHAHFPILRKHAQVDRDLTFAQWAYPGKEFDPVPTAIREAAAANRREAAARIGATEF